MLAEELQHYGDKETIFSFEVLNLQTCIVASVKRHSADLDPLQVT